MLVSSEAQRSFDAINSITKNIVPNSLVEIATEQTKADPCKIVEAINACFDTQQMQPFIMLAKMDRDRDRLSISQTLLDAVAATAMPRPKFEDNKITANDKTAIEQSHRECQRALQALTLKLFSYNAKLSKSPDAKTGDVLTCLAGLLVGYLNCDTDPVE